MSGSGCGGSGGGGGGGSSGSGAVVKRESEFVTNRRPRWANASLKTPYIACALGCTTGVYQWTDFKSSRRKEKLWTFGVHCRVCHVRPLSFSLAAHRDARYVARARMCVCVCVCVGPHRRAFVLYIVYGWHGAVRFSYRLLLLLLLLLLLGMNKGNGSGGGGDEKLSLSFLLW